MAGFFAVPTKRGVYVCLDYEDNADLAGGSYDGCGNGGLQGLMNLNYFHFTGMKSLYRPQRYQTGNRKLPVRRSGSDGVGIYAKNFFKSFGPWIKKLVQGKIIGFTVGQGGQLIADLDRIFFPDHQRGLY